MKTKEEEKSFIETYKSRNRFYTSLLEGFPSNERRKRQKAEIQWLNENYKEYQSLCIKLGIDFNSEY